MSGAFADAAALFDEDAADAPPDLVVARLAAVRWGVETQALRQLLVERLRTRVAAEEEAVDPRLSAAFAVETSAAGRDREAAVTHARRALAHPELLTQSANVSLMPEVVSVLVFADVYDEADAAIAALQTIGRANGWPLTAAMAATIAAMTAYQRGAISDAAASAREALEAQDTIWLTTIALAFLLAALVERGEASTARHELAARGLDAELPADLAGQRPAAPSRPRPRRARRPRRRRRRPAPKRRADRGVARRGRRDDAVALTARAGARDPRRARRGPGTRGVRARGGPALGRAAGDRRRPPRRRGRRRRPQTSLTEAVAVLDGSGARLEHARALTELGALLRRRGERSAAREQLGQALDLAHQCGGLAIAERARQELRIAGARPRRDALRGRDALTPSELRVARMAADGMTNRAIAQALFVTLRTVELHLTSSYAKLGIGVALHAAGVAAAGDGDRAMLTEAVAVLDASGARLEHARALTELGALLRRRGERSAARERLGQALDLAHRCGGLAIAERARQELRIAGARPRRDALRGRDALTPSELRVARMAADGMTNRSIAQALFVTLRTVELHLTSSYAKLGISSRTELAEALLAAAS